MSLFWRVFLLNAVVLVVATALLLGTVTVSTPVLLTEAAALTVGPAAMLVADALLLRVGPAPLQCPTRAISSSSAPRPWSGTAPTCRPSPARGTAWNSPGTPSAWG